MRILRPVSGFLLGLFLIAVPFSAGAAEKALGKSAVPPSVSNAGAPDGQNVEKLLYTLNGALEENRKIRQNMRDLQDAFEKVALEKSDLASQMRKIERLSTQKNQETAAKLDDFKKQLEISRKEAEELRTANNDAVKKGEELGESLKKIDGENRKLRELMQGSILESEKGQILARMKKNDEVVKTTISTISGMDGENVALRDRLIRAYFDLGNINYGLGRYENAVTQYKQVLEWDPDYAAAHHNLAIIYDYRLGKINEARREYQAYLDLKPPSEEAGEIRLRLWDLNQLSRFEPDRPLKEEFQRNQREQVERFS